MQSDFRRLAFAAVFAAVLSAPVAARAGDDPIVFDWSGYEDPALNPAYNTKYDHAPEFAFFGDEDEAFEKLRAGFKADLAHPCAQNVVKWRDAGLLQPLDASRITGWNDILPGIKAMKDLMTAADGTAWFLPFDWGNTALIYRTDKLTPEEAQSVRIFADPKFQGRVSIGDNVDDAYALAALALGLRDWTQMTDEQFKEASEFLRQVHKNVRLYWTDSTDINQAFSNDEIDMAWGWNETVASLKKEGLAVDMMRDTKEGLSTWVCGYVLLKDAPGNIDKTYDLLNARISPEVAEFMVSEFSYGHANAKGMAEIDPAVLEEKGYADVDKFLDKTLFQSPLPNDLKLKMIAEFEKIKAGY
ncbi:extracellular solute-binding protein [Mesorhizobium sp. KR1-2]|uniref:extracellular solute-binding protein n=1 Tax=Mesorhizobium sp. KR1-2 TaxID=3156609 RepID=UPI0032B3A6B2